MAHSCVGYKAFARLTYPLSRANFGHCHRADACKRRLQVAACDSS